MADVAATSTDKRSVTLLTTYNTRSVHAVTRRAQQNLRDFTAIRPCFQQFAVDNMDDNVARGTLVTLHFSKLLQTEQSQFFELPCKLNLYGFWCNQRLVRKVLSEVHVTLYVSPEAWEKIIPLGQLWSEI